jgi:Transposase IS116/IS110/IS902 family
VNLITAAKILGDTGDIRRFRSPTAFARHNGTAPVPASSGTGHDGPHRLNRGGNRQLNAALHRIAVVQARCHPGAAARPGPPPCSGPGPRPRHAGPASQPRRRRIRQDHHDRRRGNGLDLHIAVPGGIEDYVAEISAAPGDPARRRIGERYGIGVVPR